MFIFKSNVFLIQNKYSINNMLIKTNVIFLYADSLRRDFSACYILQKKLREKGYRTFICSRRNFNFFLKFLLPRKLFVIGQINMINNSRIITESYKGNIEVHFMPAEGFAYDTEYILMYPKDNDYNFLKSIFFWGKNSMEWFKKNRQIDNQNKLQLTGYTRLPIAEAYSKKITEDKNRIGFIGRFPILNDIYGRNTMTFCLVETLPEEREKVLARIDAESKAIIIYIDLFHEIITHTDYIISLRPHPNENLTTYFKLKEIFGDRFEINNDFDVAEWMSSCSKIFGLASSSYIDAFLVKTPVICLDFILGTSATTLKFDPALEWMYESCYLPKDKLTTLNLLFEKKLKPISNEKFEKLIDSDFKGKSEIVFDTVLSRILTTPIKSNYFDVIIENFMKLFDYVLATRHKLKQNNALQFDYSSRYHQISKNLEIIVKDIETRI